MRTRHWVGLGLLNTVIFAAACGNESTNNPGTGGSSSGGASQGGLNSGGSAGAFPSGGSPSQGGNTSAGASSGGATTFGGAPTAGGSPATGGSTVTAGGASPLGGSSPGGAPSDAGSFGIGGSDEGGSDAGGAGPGSTTVRGTVVDLFGHKIGNVPVTIGDETVATDAQGAFEFADVPTEYDVSVIVSPLEGGNFQANYTWLYQGLTRRNPTLQVRRATADQTGQVHLTLTSGTFATTEQTDVAFGSVDGSSTNDDVGEESTFSFGWTGPATTSGTAHALRWDVTSGGLPTGYQAYKSQPISLNGDSGTTELPIALPDNTVQSGAIAGTVTGTSTANRQNFVFVRFSSNAQIELVQDTAATSTFSYTVPTLTNSLITVAAASGYTYASNAPFSLAHKDVASGTTGIALALPDPAVPVAPVAGLNGVTTATQFQWTSTAKVFLFSAYSSATGTGIYIVTNKKQIKIPDLNGSFPLRSATAHVWRVETHGNLQSLDEATGPQGFQDSFAFYGDKPDGSSHRGDGTLAISAPRGFTTQ